MKHITTLGFTALLLSTSLSAFADAPATTESEMSDKTIAAIGLAVGSNGLTAQAIFSASPSVNVRFGANGFTLKHDFTQSGVDYTADADFKNYSSIVDWMPGESHSFRLSLGAVDHRNHVDVMGQSSLAGQKTTTTTVNTTTTVSDGSTSISVTANANGSTTLKYAGETYKIDPNKDYVYNGVTYRIKVDPVSKQSVVVNQATNVQTSLVTELTNVVAQSRLDASVQWDGFAPYVGMGFGQPFNHNRAFSWSIDVGTYYMGKPTVEGQATCLGGSEACAALAGAINDDMDKQLKELRSKLDKVTFMPVATIGLSYRF
ncbi:MAG: hypothetical protein RLY58_1877 [Pseudomonadota bacterium]|jgi:hypothetical protein